MSLPGVRHLLTFGLAEWTMGLPLDTVQEAQRMVELQSLPRTDSGPAGLLVLRGETVPVWDLRAFVGFSSVVVNPNQHIIVTRLIPGSGSTSGRQGWIVDEIHEVIDVAETKAEPFEGVPVSAFTSSMLRLDQRLILVLDTERMAQRLAELTGMKREKAIP